MSIFSEKTKKDIIHSHLRNGLIIASFCAEYGASKASVSNRICNYCEECQTNDED